MHHIVVDSINHARIFGSGLSATTFSLYGTSSVDCEPVLYIIFLSSCLSIMQMEFVISYFLSVWIALRVKFNYDVHRCISDRQDTHRLDTSRLWTSDCAGVA